MADENSTPDDAQQAAQSADGGDKLGEPGINALRSEREARKTAERELAQLRTALQQYEDRDKSELQKAGDRADKAEKAAGDWEAKYRVLASRSAVEKSATRLGAIDSEVVYLLLKERGIDYDKDGNPIGVDDAIKALQQERPNFFHTPAGARDAASTGHASTAKSMDDLLRGR